MSSKIHQTALSFLNGLSNLSSESLLAVLTPTATSEFAPSSISPHPPKNPITFTNHIAAMKDVFSTIPVIPKEIFANEEKSQVTIWATSMANFRDEVKDDGLLDEEWRFEREYIFILTMDESREKIARNFMFVDGKANDRLRELIARARRNLQQKSAVS
ncbi:hypothetical protein ASPWEDRAFT_735355 [Aspergillus wentii DTO 134E9]|uniref:SnoaL-like domain-containing protein n=1 Tax=Aspergillus wentii DTO 134E9 TaxID=1073089 RepID=A0A1L9RUY9_ASPWE|nr:uncharacterized protein ASPWEDRAFT_735355 [Aspergillus wentii DTO 134E9]KAI9928651.1 hypothetical protein MW887_001867 [Aspergillus wentii]OJJ38736.1 hypothetical protein ASPWEDRAFT_735355 [Aspergillus wentii DTO 134E9]